MAFRTPQELESAIGEHIKSHRLQKNITRKELCKRGNVSMNALRNIEGGKGATIKTLVKVLKALGQEGWIDSIAPKTSINPLHLTVENRKRKRARKTESRAAPR